MNKQQQARDKAIVALQYALGAAQAGSDLSAIDLAPVVDNIIAAATPPALTEYAEKVGDMARRLTARATNEPVERREHERDKGDAGELRLHDGTVAPDPRD